jgi:hypothetical protein
MPVVNFSRRTSFASRARLLLPHAQALRVLAERRAMLRDSNGHDSREDVAAVLKLVAGVALSGILVGCTFYSSHRLPGPWGCVSDSLGVSYTIAWSISFYPQFILNFRRRYASYSYNLYWTIPRASGGFLDRCYVCRDVSGLSVQFQVLNLLGFGCYAAYNVALFYVPFIRHEYRQMYGENIPVGFEDVVFAVHAMLITALTLIQCIIYDRGGQKICNWLGKTAGGTTILILIATIGVAAVDNSSESGARLTWITLILSLSAVKLVVSLVKYIPQVCTMIVLGSLCHVVYQLQIMVFAGGFSSCSCAGHAQRAAAVNCRMEHHQRDP